MNESPGNAGGFNVVKVGTIAAIACAIAIGIWAYTRYGGDRLFAKAKPEVVKVRGSLVFRDKPVTGGEVRSVFLDDTSLFGGLSGVKDDGTFEFMTDGGEGVLEDGLYVGKHRIVVLHYLPGGGGGQGPLAVPAVYADNDKSPLEIEVTKAKAVDGVIDLGVIVLEDDGNTISEEEIAQHLERIQAGAQAGAAMRGPRGGDAEGAGQGGGPGRGGRPGEGGGAAEGGTEAAGNDGPTSEGEGEAAAEGEGAADAGGAEGEGSGDDGTS